MRTGIVALMVFLSAFAFLSGIDQQPAPQAFVVGDETPAYTDLQFALPAFDIESTRLGDTEYRRVSVPGAAVTLRAGYPELPVFSVTLRIPDTGTARVSVIESGEYAIPDFRPVPSQGVQLHGPVRDIAADPACYQGADFYPADPVRISKPALLRDMRLVTVSICPFVYDPVSNELRVRNTCTLRVEYGPGHGDNELVRSMRPSRAFAPFYRTVANYRTTRDEAPEYQRPCLVLICRNDESLLENVQMMADWKRSKGFEVHIQTFNAGVSTNQVRDYLLQAYTTWENPPEYVDLIGDVAGTLGIPCYFENLTEDHGATDHPYSELAGDDVLADVFLGRISVESILEFQTFLAKMDQYERTVGMSFPEMYNHSLLVADINPSGISTVLTMYYIRDCMLGWDPDHTFTEQYGTVSPGVMNAAIDAGSLFFAYRGYIGMSGWYDDNIAQLNNVNKLTNAVLLTCDTGAYNGTARVELLLRAGTPVAPKGAVSAVGMSTASTHTQFNNILEAGMFYGLYSDRMYDMGSAVARGKLALYESYINIDDTQVEIFSLWCNLMGDPSLQIWHATPLPMQAVYDHHPPLGSSHLDVAVTDGAGLPLAGAWVTASNADHLSTGFTGPDGAVTVDINPEATGEYNLVVTKPDYLPRVETFTHALTGNTGCTQVTVDDDMAGGTSGNGNQQANPGETIDLDPALKNYSGGHLAGVSASMTTADAYITVIDSMATYGDMNALQEVWPDDAFRIQLRADTPDRHRARLELHVRDTSGATWTTPCWLEVSGVDLDPVSASVTDDNNQALDPGETAELRIRIVNNGQVTLSGVTAVLSSTSDKITIDGPESTYGILNPGGEADGTGFTVTARSTLIPGMRIPVTLTLSNLAGYQETEEYSFVAGHPVVTDPLGPDDGGYLCFDDGDTGYEDCPVYDWVEIDPAYGGQGIDTGLSDNYEEDDKIAFFDLPFSFSFYGVPYQQVGICTNGFICFTFTGQCTFRNWPVPGPKGPSPMIAAMWDDLRTTGGRILHWFDPANHRYVIEWSRCQDPYGETETFEIILYDPLYYPTPSMNGPVKIQYKDFLNSDSVHSPGAMQGNYCTVGLEDATGRIGLQYTYNDQYPEAAREITSQTALYFTGIPMVYAGSYLVMGNIAVHDPDGNGLIAAGDRVRFGIQVNNLGQQAAGSVHATLSSTDPYITVTHGTSEYPDIPSGGHDVNIRSFTVQVDPECPDNHLSEFLLQLTDDQGTWSYSFSVRVYRPQVELVSYLINDRAGNNNGIADPGETVSLAVTLRNSGRAACENLTATLVSTSPYVQVTGNTIDYGTLAPDGFIQGVFTLAVRPDTPSQTTLSLNLSAVADNNATLQAGIPLGISVLSRLLEDHFDSGDFTNWEFDAHESNWRVVDDSSAGGSTPEAHLVWDPFWTGTSRMISQPMNLVGATDVSIEFRHYLGVFNGTNIEIGVAVRNGLDDWQTLWSRNASVNIASELVTVPIPQAMTSGSDLQVCFYFEGNVYNINIWAIDDVVVHATLGNSAVVNGSVFLTDSPASPAEATVTVGNFATHPNLQGVYSLFVAPGEYGEITATAPFHVPASVSALDLSIGESLDNCNFALPYLAPANAPALEVHNTTVTLSWTFDGDSGRSRAATRQPGETRVAFRHFEVWRQTDTGPFVLADTTRFRAWSEATDTTRTHRYYIVVRYDEGVSDSTRHVVQEGNTATGSPTQAPAFTGLSGNYPNPFNPDTRIAFSLAQAGPVSLAVYNLRGQRVRTLLHDQMTAPGPHEALWNGLDDVGRPSASGIYLFRLYAGGQSFVRKATLLK